MAYPTGLTSAVDGVTDVLSTHLNALETKVGIDSSAVTTSHDYKLGEVTGTDKAVGKSATQTLTAKTLTSPVINVGSDATGDLYYRSAGVYTRLGIGSTDQILTVASGLPSWATPGVTASAWASAGETWTYSSATAITVPSDGTTKYNKGDKIRIKQGGGYKYFYVTAVTATSLTVTGGTDYTVANAAITDNYYSKADNPLDFPDWFAYTATPTWDGTPPSGVTTTVARFSVKARTCFVLTKQNNTVAGASNTQVTFAGPIAANVTSGEYSTPGNGLVSTAEIASVPTASARAISYSTTPDVYLFFTSLAAKSFEVSLFYPI